MNLNSVDLQSINCFALASDKTHASCGFAFVSIAIVVAVEISASIVATIAARASDSVHFSSIGVLFSPFPFTLLILALSVSRHLSSLASFYGEKVCQRH